MFIRISDVFLLDSRGNSGFWNRNQQLECACQPELFQVSRHESLIKQTLRKVI